MKFPEIATLKKGDTVRFSFNEYRRKYIGTVTANLDGVAFIDIDGGFKVSFSEDDELHSFEILRRA